MVSKVAVFKLGYLSQKLSVCSCTKWPVHQMLSTQVLRRVVYSAETLPDCPLSKIIRIIGIKPVLSCTDWIENKSIYFWFCHSLEHRNGTSNAKSTLKHMYKPVKIYFLNVLLIYRCALEERAILNPDGINLFYNKPLICGSDTLVWSKEKKSWNNDHRRNDSWFITSYRWMSVYICRMQRRWQKNWKHNLHSRSCSWALLAKGKESLNFFTVYGPQKPSLKHVMKVLPSSLQGTHHLLKKGSNVPEKVPGAHLLSDISSLFKVVSSCLARIWPHHHKSCLLFVPVTFLFS